MNPKFKIENGNIVLLKVNNFVHCMNCHQSLALNSQGIVLIKTFATLLDLEKQEITFKCGKCKQFNTLKFEDLTNPDAQCLLGL